MRFCFLLIVFLILFSCEKEASEASIWVNATVANTKDINCGLPTLSFVEDSLKVRKFTGEQWEIFVVKGLPPAFNEQNKKLRVQIAKLKPEESFVCLTLGPNYPQIKVLNAEPR